VGSAPRAAVPPPWGRIGQTSLGDIDLSLSRLTLPARAAVAAGILAFALSACGGATPPTAPTAAPSAVPEATPAASPAGSKDLILATTTSTQDSGLLDVLVPAFEKVSGYTIKTVAVGSGEAIKMGQEGNADVLLVHSPAAEKTFVDSGVGIDRQLVMHNTFQLVGPAADPARVKDGTSIVDAFTAIANAKATFVSRGDGSGTEAKELGYWKKAGISPAAPWYLQSGQGMAATLRIASEKAGYTLVDIATWAATKGDLALETLLTKDASLLNPYHVIRVNPASFPKVNEAGARAFSEWILSPAAQELIGAFGTDTYGMQLFVPDAGKSDADLTAP